jgi:hypothetical protein
MKRDILIICFMAAIALSGCEMPKSSEPATVKIVEPLETGPLNSCKANTECWCRNFTGAEFLPSKVESKCKNNQCVTCIYD